MCGRDRGLCVSDFEHFSQILGKAERPEVVLFDRA
jgi:hypothetical protein